MTKQAAPNICKSRQAFTLRDLLCMACACRAFHGSQPSLKRRWSAVDFNSYFFNMLTMSFIIDRPAD
jgi:hypothetical protein